MKEKDKTRASERRLSEEKVHKACLDAICMWQLDNEIKLRIIKEGDPLPIRLQKAIIQAYNAGELWE